MSSIEARLRVFEAELRPPRLPETDIAYSLHGAAVGRLVLAVARSGTVLACSYDSEESVTGRLARAVSPRVVRDPAVGRSASDAALVHPQSIRSCPAAMSRPAPS